MPPIKVGDLVEYNECGKQNILPYRPKWMRQPMVVEEVDFTDENLVRIKVAAYNNPKLTGEELERYLQPL